MSREIITCTECGRIVARYSWKTPPRETAPGEISGIYWCRFCQKEFAFTSKFIPKGRRYTIDGYVIIKVPGRGWLREHIYIWEKANSKSLPVGYVVHHINGIKDDNRPDNLIAIPRKSHSSHLLTTNRKNGIHSPP